MNILIVSGFWPTSSNSISGIFVVQQVAALARAGATITVLIPIAIGRKQSHLPPDALGLDNHHINLIEVPVLRLPEKLTAFLGGISLNTFLYGVMIDKYISNLIKKYKFDGCVVHGARYVGLSLPFWRKNIDGAVIIVLHGFDPMIIDLTNHGRAHSLFHKAGVIANKIVLVGNSLMNYAISVGLPLEKLKVVPNGAVIPALNNVSFEQRSILEVRHILSVSNLLKWKGIDDNLRALADIALTHPHLKWEYRIVGEGPFRSELEQLAINLNIRQRVKFLGRLSYENTMQEIANCDVFSLPSWGEAFGIVYLEAMARGRSVIGCLHNGAQDIITNDIDGLLVEPKDKLSLSNALTKLLSRPDVCSMLGKNARATSEGFTWDINANRILDIITADT